MSGLFSDVADAVFAPVLTTDRVDVSFSRAPEDAQDGDWDSVLRIKDAKTSKTMDAVALDARRIWYLPTVIFLALCAAAPLGGLRSLAVALPLGLLLLPLLSLLPILSFLADNHVVALEGAARSILDIAYRTLVAPLGMMYFVPAFLWFVLVVLTRPLTTAPAAAR